MNEDIKNFDEQGNYHGEQIEYHPNGNISWIENFNHGLWHGYSIYFNSDKSIQFKQYWNMDNRIYIEHHGWHKQIQINI